MPAELIERKIESGGKDFIQLRNGSIIHFIGLDDPVRWYSSEIGVFIVDQVEECSEETIVKLITRLRHPASPMGMLPDTPGYREWAGTPIAGKVILSFNPENPGHWLRKWFFDGAVRTRWGFAKDELYAADAARPLGDCEFFFAKATDNPHLPPGYVEQTLQALPEHLRRRYLEGYWEFISGTCYFDTEALLEYQERAAASQPVLQGFTDGDCVADAKARLGQAPVTSKLRLRAGKGPWSVWQKPVRKHFDAARGREVEDYRYVVAVDVSSGGSTDYSGIQVVCVETFEQVAEFQGKLDPDLVAQEAYRIGRIYNNACIVPETTGGWGFSVDQELKRLRYPNPYTRKLWDRLSKKWTDRTGWDTTVKTRAHMLDTLERVIRERELGIHSLRTVGELGTFVRDDAGRPAAQPGTNDDLVVSLAIGVTVAADMPRELRKVRQRPHRPAVSSVTGY